MEAVRTVTGVAAPLMRDHINTDAILPSTQMQSVEMTDLGMRLFYNWRYDGSLADPKPDFVLNIAPYDHAVILLGGDNFGCGSSREMAVWALKQFGIRCIIAHSFGSIFRANCIQNAILPVALPREIVEGIAEEVTASAGRGEIKIDLEACRIALPSGASHEFFIADDDRRTLLDGLDAMDRALLASDQIKAFAANDHDRRPWIYHLPR